MPFDTDVNLTAPDIAGLISTDAVAAFFQNLGYDTARRSGLTPQAIGLTGDAATPIKSIEILSEDAEGFLRVVFVQLKSLTAKSRNDLARVLGRTNVDHLLVFVSNFDALEFVLLDKRKEQRAGPGGTDRVQVVPLSITVDRRAPAPLEMRAIRRLTWTCRDALDQFDKLRTIFEAAAFKESRLYDHLQRLFRAMDQGDPSLNVPTYNGGLFLTSPPAAPGGPTASPPLARGGRRL